MLSVSDDDDDEEEPPTVSKYMKALKDVVSKRQKRINDRKLEHQRAQEEYTQAILQQQIDLQGTHQTPANLQFIKKVHDFYSRNPPHPTDFSSADAYKTAQEFWTEEKDELQNILKTLYSKGFVYRPSTDEDVESGYPYGVLVKQETELTQAELDFYWKEFGVSLEQLPAPVAEEDYPTQTQVVESALDYFGRPTYGAIDSAQVPLEEKSDFKADA